MRCSFGILLVLAAPAYADRFDDIVAQCATGHRSPVCNSLRTDPPVQAVLDDDLAAQQAAAAADPPVIAKPPLIDHEQELHWQAELDIRTGSLRADGLDLDYVFGLNAAAGLRTGRLAVLGEYAIAAVTFPQMSSLVDSSQGSSLPIGPTDGLMHRFGVLARYSVAKVASYPSRAQGGRQAIGHM